MVSVEIHKKATGEVMYWPMDYEWDGGYEYMWSLGNYACDCNRALFFQYATGATPETAKWGPCSEGEYSVRIKDSGGKIVYDEMPGSILR